MTDRPLKRKYARIERERRFALKRLPAGLDPGTFQRLRDCYVRDTHLRLRQVETPDGEIVIVKLGQKIVDPEAPEDPRRRQMTTIYFDAAEAAALRLDGLRTVKRRYKHREQGWTFCIDVWEQPTGAAGVIVAEVECPTDAELDAVTCPSWAEGEVTEDPAYSAILLAQR